MSDTASMTLNLSRREMDAVEELAAAQELSKTALIRSALRLYQLVTIKARNHEHLAFVDDAGNVIRTEIVGCGVLE